MQRARTTSRGNVRSDQVPTALSGPGAAGLQAPSPIATDACAHCRRPLGFAASGDDVVDRETEHLGPDGRAYCCRGCASARAVIERLGLTRFDAMGGSPGPVAEVELDERSALAMAALAAEACRGSHRITVEVEGVTCASCAWLVEKVARKAPGVRSAILNPARGELELLLTDAFEATPLARSLAAIGHRVTLARGAEAARRASPLDELLFRFAVSAAAAMAAMISSFSLFFGLEPSSPFGRVFTGLAVLASLVAVVIGGQPFLRGAWRSLRAGAPSMDVPIALGMVLAEIGCLLSARAGNLALFDTVSVFVTLMLLGRLLERRLVERHRHLLLSSDDDVNGLEVRRLLPDGATRFVAVRDIERGFVLQLARGELCPVDAVLQAPSAAGDDGERSFSFAWLTGESATRPLSAGAPLPAGAHVDDRRGAVVVADAPFSATRLAALLSHRPDASSGEEDRSAASGLFPWLARAWVAGAFVVASAGALLWRDAGLLRTLDVVATLLVVTCPCAFGIAAPLAIERALVLLRRHGVFVTSARVWWRARSIRHAVFDKTGTLTLAEPSLTSPSLEALRAWPADAQAALRAVALQSNHGRSRAIARALPSTETGPRGVVCEEVPGVGLRARVTTPGGASIEVTLLRDDEEAAATCVTVGAHRLALSFEEALRPGAALELTRLRALGVELWLATGDDDAKAQALAARLGIPADHVRARCAPEDKAALVDALGAHSVLAIGDGVNDAAMFARAAVCGVPTLDRPHLPARADFLLLGTAGGGSFGRIIDLLVLARRVRAVLVGLLSVATLYNVAVVAAGLAGMLTPLSVALLMPASSLSLLLAAHLLVRLPAASAPSISLHVGEVPA